MALSCGCGSRQLVQGLLSRSRMIKYEASLVRGPGGNGDHMEAAGWTASPADCSFPVALPCVSSLIKMPLLGNLALVKSYPDRRAAPHTRRRLWKETRNSFRLPRIPFVCCSVRLMAATTRAPWFIAVFVPLQNQGCSCLPPGPTALVTLF